MPVPDRLLEIIRKSVTVQNLTPENITDEDRILVRITAPWREEIATFIRERRGMPRQGARPQEFPRDTSLRDRGKPMMDESKPIETVYIKFIKDGRQVKISRMSSLFQSSIWSCLPPYPCLGNFSFSVDITVNVILPDQNFIFTVQEPSEPFTCHISPFLYPYEHELGISYSEILMHGVNEYGSAVRHLENRTLDPIEITSVDIQGIPTSTNPDPPRPPFTCERDPIPPYTLRCLETLSIELEYIGDYGTFGSGNLVIETSIGTFTIRLEGSNVFFPG